MSRPFIERASAVSMSSGGVDFNRRADIRRGEMSSCCRNLFGRGPTSRGVGTGIRFVLVFTIPAVDVAAPLCCCWPCASVLVCNACMAGNTLNGTRTTCGTAVSGSLTTTTNAYPYRMADPLNDGGMSSGRIASMQNDTCDPDGICSC